MDPRRMASCRQPVDPWGSENLRRGIRQAAPRRPAARDDRAGAPAHPQDRSRSRSSRPTPSRRPRTRPRRSSSSPRSARRAWRSGSTRSSRSRSSVAILLAIVVTSYRQTIFAYPSGGGSYVVSRENLGEMPSLVAGASLLVDYILTVAVSISAGVAAIVSIPAFQDLADHRVELGLVLIVVITRREPARDQGVGPHLRGADLHLHRDPRRCSSATGCSASFFGNLGHVPFDPKEFDGSRIVGGTLGLFLILQGLLVGRGRAHRRRGDLQRRPRVPAARSRRTRPRR